jgi:hypothetical protein
MNDSIKALLEFKNQQIEALQRELERVNNLNLLFNQNVKREQNETDDCK